MSSDLAALSGWQSTQTKKRTSKNLRRCLSTWSPSDPRTSRFLWRVRRTTASKCSGGDAWWGTRGRRSCPRSPCWPLRRPEKRTSIINTRIWKGGWQLARRCANLNHNAHDDKAGSRATGLCRVPTITELGLPAAAWPAAPKTWATLGAQARGAPGRARVRGRGASPLPCWCADACELLAAGTGSGPRSPNERNELGLPEDEVLRKEYEGLRETDFREASISTRPHQPLPHRKGRQRYCSSTSGNFTTRTFTRKIMATNSIDKW